MTPKTILVPTDFSDHSIVALDYAVELAAKLDARLHLLHVVAMPNYGYAYATGMWIEGVMTDAQRDLDALAAARSSKVALGPTLVKTSDPRDEIQRTATELEADLIIMGTHGRRGIQRLILGSVAEAVVRTAHCPVLTVRGGVS